MCNLDRSNTTEKIKKPWVGVQIHFGQPFDMSDPAKNIAPRDINKAFAKIKNVINVDGVFAGFSKIPSHYDYAVKIIHDLGAKAYLWYGVLADVGEDIRVPPDAYMVNYLGEANDPWGQIQSENFQFICPNNSFVNNVVIPRAIRLVEKHGFDGIFLDRIRFPSFATGLENNLCCFCESCRQKAADNGIDLIKIRNNIGHILDTVKNADKHDLRYAGDMLKTGSAYDLIHLSEDLSEFYKFREGCITSMIKKISDEMRKMGKEVGLDLFSPSLSPFVSQNYPQLCKYSDWIKSMSYCYAVGPACLPLETGSIINILKNINKDWTYKNLEVFIGDMLGIEKFSISHEDKKIGPVYDILKQEMNRARTLSCDATPVYPGFEAVNLPGICNAGQKEMEQYLAVLKDENLDGFILSWTLPLIAKENIKVFADYLNIL